MAKAQVGGPRTEEVPPDPAAMIESMRAFGYSLPTVIADLVDNSITADASLIAINFEWAGSGSWILVSDDGHGMTADVLTNAMRLGSTSPRETRAPHDLGRFGLGLKTAAFSQGSAMTVVSRAQGEEEQLRSWDLAHVGRTRTWSLICDSVEDDEPAGSAIRNTEHGTSVLIKRLDRLVGEADTEDEAAHTRFLQQIEQVREHLAMVFHRFLESRARIEVNGVALDPWDPFLSTHPATQELPRERLPFKGDYVDILPFVLPHHSRLETDQHRAAAGIRGWNLHQGFYVYRAKRLLVAGDWLGLPFQKEEHHKLARIRVDITNAMDLTWQIDVRKAVARIPRPLRGEFKRIADATRRRGSEAYRYRGRRLARAANVDRRFVWTSSVNRGTVAYKVDRNHPLIAEALSEIGEARPAVERAIRIVEETLPVQAIMIDRRERPDDDREPFQDDGDEVNGMLRSAFESMVASGARPTDALAVLARMEPFDAHPELIATLEEEQRGG